MTTEAKNQESPGKENRLLSAEERAVLSQIATKEPPHSARAQALLAIDDGTPQTEAARQAGLTHGQVRYWLIKFREERTAAFPEELLGQAQRDAGVEAAAQEEDAPEPKKKAKKKSKKQSKKKSKKQSKKKSKKQTKKKSKKKSTKKPKKKSKKKTKKGKKPAKKSKKKSKK